MLSDQFEERVAAVLWNDTESNRGKFGEAVWKNVFVGCDIDYIPLCEINTGGAPKLKSSAFDTVLPDFDVTTGRRRAYADSKCKKNVVRYRKANELRHGIDRRVWDQYSRVMEKNRQKCLVCILQLFGEQNDWCGTLLANSLIALGTPIGGFSNQHHMVYWPVSRFKVISESIPPTKLWELGKSGKYPSEIDRKSLRELINTGETIQSVLF